MKLRARSKKRDNAKGGMTARQKAIKRNKRNTNKKPLTKTSKDIVQYNEKTFFESSVQISGDSEAEEVLQFIELDMTLYGKEEDTFKIREMTGNTKGYDKTKLHIVNIFFNVLKCHKTLKNLATVEKNKKTVFENICGGVRNKYKKI